MTAFVMLAPTTAAFGFCGHCHGELDPGHRCIPAIVEAPDLPAHWRCTQCDEMVGRHGKVPATCAVQPFGSAECAREWAEAPRPAFSVPTTFTVPVLRDEYGGQWLPGDAPDDGGGEFAAGPAYYGRRAGAP
jgi:hypothetical protein